MKKLLLACAALLGSVSLAVSAHAGGTIVVGASPTPHAEILAEAAKLLKPQGYTLKIVEYSDYVQPNVALDSKELDANYFQHKPYLDDFNAQKGTKLVSLGPVHYEPFGIYAGKAKSLKDLKKGSLVAVPNDATNEGRALLLMEATGLIKLKENAGLAATVRDIAENPLGLKIEEIEAAQLVRSLPDVDVAIINGNYAILGGLKVADALAVESADSLAASTYANILAIRAGDEKRPDLQALYSALVSSEAAAFMKQKYAGAVLPSVAK
ncbi:MetQ/NlpA family ABC transporter substrate-binding protein [uncultured Desulfovibrio sp.]|uniref:MetQ/NlpA family ABC transporter substrate-binding protein n=1 Tax=uncultured Desulfovibrio sp. TaxID=167968 RepID=UPI002603715E|nr:MetQ/NlpA family ABC transporter substrate-binding protein [uncultured Desulfovibrio sp.]